VAGKTLRECYSCMLFMRGCGCYSWVIEVNWSMGCG